jgi:hypothetical protein
MKMRNLMTTVAMILTLGVATPALADSSQNHGFGNGQSYGQPYDGADGSQNRGFGNGQSYGQARDGQTHTDRANGPAFVKNNFGYVAPRRDLGDWERTWGPWQGERFGAHDTLPRWQLVRRLEAQGYHNVSNLTPGRFGNGWRAFASYRHSPVVVRLDPFTGRVLAARYV